MVRITVDTSDFKRLSKELDRFKKAQGYAQRNALNGCAFALQAEWRSQVRSTFTNRNAFTERSIRVDKATGYDPRSMKAVTGSIADYMGTQESGGTVHGSGPRKSIPSAYAGGGKPGGGVRPKPVRAAFRLGGISVARTGLGRYGRRQQNAAAINIAVAKGQRFALLNRATGKGKGLFEVKGLKRRQKGLKLRAKANLLWDFSRSSVHLRPEPTMHRALAVSSGRFQKIAEAAMVDQLRRHKVFGY